MSSEEQDPLLTLNQLSTQLEAFKSALEPLLKTPFQDVVQGVEPLEKARVEVMTAYMVHELIKMYLQVSAVDPESHAVTQELERLRSYFTKLRAAGGSHTTGLSSNPSAPSIVGTDPARMKLNKDVTNRFIFAAISSKRPPVDPAYSTATTEEQPVAGPSGTHTRFESDGEKERKMGEKVEELLKDDDDEDEDDEEEGEGSEENEGGNGGGETKEEETKKMVATPKSEKKARPKTDPFAGYDSPKPSSKKSNIPKHPLTSSPKKHARPTEGEGEVEGRGEKRLSKNQRKKLKLKEQAGGKEV